MSGFTGELRVTGAASELNAQLEHGGRVADFFELAELMCIDALHREESCDGHFREEHQTAEGEAKRNDADFCYAAAWQWLPDGVPSWSLHEEPLVFENVRLSERSYE